MGKYFLAIFLLVFIPVADGQDVIKGDDASLILKAHKCDTIANIEWDRRNKTFSQKAELDSVFRAIDLTPLHTFCRLSTATSADLLIKINDSVLLDTISLDVLNPDDNRVVYHESRDRVALSNDVKRLVAHFLEEVDALRLIDIAKRHKAAEQDALRSLAKALPIDWESSCPTDEKDCKPTGNKYRIWIAGNLLYEVGERKVSERLTLKTECTTKREIDEQTWEGTCAYRLIWNKLDDALPDSKAPECKVETSEQITEVTTSRIKGVSQAMDLNPLKERRCPIAGIEYHKFLVTPASTERPITQE